MLCQTPCPRCGAAAFLRVCFIHLPSMHLVLSTVGLSSVLSVHSTAPCTAGFGRMGAGRPQHVHLIVSKTETFEMEDKNAADWWVPSSHKELERHQWLMAVSHKVFFWPSHTPEVFSKQKLRERCLETTDKESASAYFQSGSVLSGRGKG